MLALIVAKIKILIVLSNILHKKRGCIASFMLPPDELLSQTHPRSLEVGLVPVISPVRIY